MPVISGGIALASGVLGAFGSSSSAKAQAMAQQMQQDQANFNNKWQNEAQNRNLLRQWGAQQQINMQLEKAANQQYAVGSVYLRKNYQNAASLQSRQTAAVTDQFLAAVSARGLDPNSASSRALLRQAARQSQLDSAAAAQSYAAAGRSLKTEAENILSQRQLGGPEQRVYLPTTGGIADTSASALTTGLMQAGLSSFGAAYEARRQNMKNNSQNSSWFAGLEDLFK